MNILRHMKVIATLVVSMMLAVQPAYSEDIQIYLEGADESAGANVLFLLETAGQVNANFKGNVCPGGKVSDEMFCAMDMVVNALSGNMRVGIAAQNRGGTTGGHIGFAIANLEETTTPVSVSRVVSEAGDAVQERADRLFPWELIDITTDTMLLPPDRPSAGHFEATRRVGFVFDGIAVPSWARVTSARLELTMPKTDSRSEWAYTSFQKSGDPVLFDTLLGEDLQRDWSDSVRSRMEMKGDSVTIDVTEIVQGAVSRSEWCGRNDMVLMLDRTSINESQVPEVYSFRAENADGNRLGQPRLVVEWDPDSSPDAPHTQPAGEKSCMGGVRLALQSGADDASEAIGDGSVVTTANQLLAGRNQGNAVSGLSNNTNYLSGLRFADVTFGSETEVGEARLHMRVDEGNPLIVSSMLGNTGAFGASHSISSRPKGSSVTVNPGKGDFSVDVTDQVQEIFKSAGWSSGSAMGFRLDAVTPGDRDERVRIQAREGGAASAYLTMSVLASKPSQFVQSISKRDDIKNALAEMQSGAGGGHTKTGASYVESARYLKELSPRFGDLPYADPDAFTNSSREKYAGLNLGPGECAGDTHIIMVSNKDPNGGDLSAAQSGYSELTGKNCGLGEDGWECIQATAAHLLSEGVVTHAVNFADNLDLEDKMQRVAMRGGGEYRYASNALELAEVIADILDSIIITDASMAAPGVAVNQLNRFRHLDQLYYALFRPSLDTRWEGNLKRYRLDFNTGEIVDENGVPAVDPETGFFRSSSNSWWGKRDDGLDLPDGSDVTLGGAREELEFGKTRRLFYAKTMPSPGGAVDSTTRPAGTGLVELASVDDVTAEMLGMDPDETDAADLEARVEMLLGGWGDPLHSEPRLVNYGFEGTFGEASGNEDLQDNVVFVTTNDGMLHAIDPKTGKEIFSFIPPDELLKTDERFRGGRLDADDPQRWTYGLDGGITVWRQASSDGSGKAQRVFLYLAQRRGGRNYYALDVSDRENPRLMWTIRGGSGAYGNLGESWAAPTLAQIVLDGKLVPVLVIAGGYSPDDHDKTGSVSTGDKMGNGIYIVNANNGALIWSTSDSGTATITHPDMKWAIPAGISVVDVDFNGVIDYLYAADLGGQVFRVDLNTNNSGPGDLAHRVATVAQLGTADPDNGGIGDHRRFHASPVVALGRRDGETILQVAIGSGYRSHPLNTQTNDRIYLLDDGDALRAREALFVPSAPIRQGDLLDVTTDMDPDPEDLNASRGWMIRLDNGEKVLSAASIIDGVIYMSSYLPETAYADPCQRVVGMSRLYGLRLADGGPALVDNAGNLKRSEDLVLPGLPPSPQVLLGPEGKQVVLIGTAAVDPGTSGDFRLRRTRWFEVPNEAEAEAALENAMYGEPPEGEEENGEQ